MQSVFSRFCSGTLGQLDRSERPVCRFMIEVSTLRPAPARAEFTVLRNVEPKVLDTRTRLNEKELAVAALTHLISVNRSRLKSVVLARVL